MKSSNGCSITSSRPLRGALAALLGAILMSGAAVAAPPTYSIVLLPELPDTQGSEGFDISDAGQIVGHAYPASGDNYGISWNGTPYAPQRLADLPSNSQALALAVNDVGLVAGFAQLNTSHVAVMWDPSGAIIKLGDLPGGPLESRASDINNSSVAVGYGTANRNMPVFWTAPGATSRLALGPRGNQRGGGAQALNDFGDIVGYYFISDSVYHAALWPAGQQQLQDLGGPLGGSKNSMALGINNAGQVVGYFGRRAVRWNSDGSMTDLGNVGGESYAPNDINQVGDITGTYYSYIPHRRRGFLWTAEDGMMDLYDLIDPADPLRAQFAADDVAINAINASGLIVGAMFLDPEDPSPHAIVLVPQE